LVRGRHLAFDVGSYALTGQAATLTADRALALAAGSYALTGQAATLDYSGTLLQVYTANVFVNLLPNLIIACNLTPTQSVKANPSPDEEVKIG
jgi:hypothetical protein